MMISVNFPALDVIEHLQNRREAQFLQFVFRQFKLADRREIFDWDIVDLELFSRSHDDQFLSCCCSRRRHFANGRGDAVDIFERVGEPGALVILQRLGNFTGHFLENLSEPFARGRLAVKPVNVRREDDQDGRDRAERLHPFHEVPARDLLDKFLEEAKGQLFRDHVRHEKGAAFRFGNSRRVRRPASPLLRAARNNRRVLSKAKRSPAWPARKFFPRARPAR